MNAFIVDTNVPVIANGRSSQADPDCVIACIVALTEVRDHGVILLDDALLILHEYMRNLSMSGQPGLGDFFMKWVWTIQAHPNHCKQVTITPRTDDPTNFIEFPNDADLTGFDRSDRKFVAVALASGNAPDVLDAVDSDWADYFAALTRNGIRLRFLCPQHVFPRE
jgi:hypothetical protein